MIIGVSFLVFIIILLFLSSPSTGGTRYMDKMDRLADKASGNYRGNYNGQHKRYYESSRGNSQRHNRRGSGRTRYKRKRNY